ncbi:acetylornithine deacetylase [Dermatophilus congolensis]|uniref:acetylornithine deacetylase n=1 Tax=Dermatophilus congolensis TaxID=1863 RepID=UPI001AAF6B30|nr:acetylornithine deacetylase [Dermatophilus congolensis]MBO3141384.1 acetylornithine deacetylase [Dermatophilus congolensis]MBO3153566.1 acetylornithine deacetylase [Dermatophilus congolensis]MBO3187426.1 acetylornithine deacetylase [Dermatophilus congolensis]MBO3196430.1 acetylornithine deacetylase [Dermatophilus congolensis]MBO3215816.1 acetylornithine deacetylase [Dermatophilus congolensis]
MSESPSFAEQPGHQQLTEPFAEPKLRCLDWIRRLVSYDTTSRNSNLELITAVITECERLGLTARVFPAPAQEKANVVVTVPDRYGRTDGGVMVSGHTDTVPVDGQAWSCDPFTVRVADGRLYGRGVCDMKGYIGVVLEALPRFAAASLNEPFRVALTYDEELACLGAEHLVAQLPGAGLVPRVVFVGEPTRMQVVTAHKSMSVVQVRFRGVPAHSSLPSAGVNAIEHAAELVLYLRGLADAWVRNGPFDDAYVVPHTTLSVNMLAGGTARNIVPGECLITFEFRSLPEISPEVVISEVKAEAARIGARMNHEHPDADVDVEVLATVPALDSDPGGVAAEYARSCGGVVPGPKVTYGTEAGLFAGLGADAVVCGPGDIAQAHTPDEWIEVSQLAACEEFFDALLHRMTQ